MKYIAEGIYNAFDIYLKSIILAVIELEIRWQKARVNRIPLNEYPLYIAMCAPSRQVWTTMKEEINGNIKRC